MGFPKITDNHFVLLQTEARTGHILKKDQSPYVFGEQSEVLFTVCDSLDDAKKQADALIRRHPGIEVNIYNSEEEVVEVIRDEMFLKKTVRFAAPSVGNFRWRVAGQLFLALLIGFLLQNVMSVAIADEMFKREVLDIGTDLEIDDTINKLLAEKMRSVEITFAVALTVGFLFMGWMIDAAGTRRGLGVVMILASLASIAAAFVSSANGLHVSRFVMGLSIGGMIPAALKGVVEWFPKRERAWASGILGAGMLSGWLITALAVPFLLQSLGWKFTFIIAGLLGFIWLAWWYFSYQKPEEQKGLSVKELAFIWNDPTHLPVTEQATWFQLWSIPKTWLLAVCFLLTVPLWLLWIELPDGFGRKSAFNLSLQDFTFSPSFIIFALAGITGSLVTGWFSIRLLRQNRTLTSTRQTLLLICALLPLCLLTLFFVPKGIFFTLVVAVALAAHQGWFSQVYVLASDSFPKNKVASVVGIASAFGVAGSMILAYFAQYLLQSFGQGSLLVFSLCYLLAFVIIRKKV